MPNGSVRSQQPVASRTKLDGLGALERMVQRAHMSLHCRAWHERAMQALDRSGFYARMTEEFLLTGI